MLNIWINLPEDMSKFIYTPDIAFMDYMDFRLVTSELGAEMIKNLSEVTKIHSSRLFSLIWWKASSLNELGDNVKMLFLMMCKELRDLGVIFNYRICGDNCNVYLEKFASEYDINIYAPMTYFPSDEFLEQYGVKFMESGLEVHNIGDFFHEMLRLERK